MATQWVNIIGLLAGRRVKALEDLRIRKNASSFAKVLRTLERNAMRPPIVFFNRVLDSWSPSKFLVRVLKEFLTEPTTFDYRHIIAVVGRAPLKGTVQKTRRRIRHLRQRERETRRFLSLLVDCAEWMMDLTRLRKCEAWVVVTIEIVGPSVTDDDYRGAELEPHWMKRTMKGSDRL